MARKGRKGQNQSVAKLAAALTRQLNVAQPKRSKKARKQRPRRQRQGGNMPQRGTQHADIVEGLINPFSNSAHGSQIPDTGAGRTLPERYVATGVLSTDANGNAFIGFQPNTFYPIINGTLDAPGANATTAATATAGGTASFANHSSALRVVSMGVRITPVQSALNVAGTIHLAKQQQLFLGSTFPVNQSALLEYETHSLTSGAEYSIVAHATGNDTAEWVVTSTVNSNGSEYTGGYESLMFFLTGGTASTPVLRYEFTLNLEYKIPPNDALAVFQKPQPIYNPSALVAVNSVHTDHTGLFRGLKHELGAEMRKRAERAAVKHMGALGKIGVAAASL